MSRTQWEAIVERRSGYAYGQLEQQKVHPRHCGCAICTRDDDGDDEDRTTIVSWGMESLVGLDHYDDDDDGPLYRGFVIEVK